MGYAFSGGYDTVDPTVTDDASKGWGIGRLWVNTATGSYFVCTSGALGAAVWRKVRSNSVANGLVAAGTVQADALVLAADVNIVATAGAGTGVKLPAVTYFGLGDRIAVRNEGASTMNVFPPTGAAINAAAVNAAVTLAAGASAEYVYVAANTFKQI